MWHTGRELVVQVGGEVLGEVVCPGEALATHLTVVGSLSCVDSQVAIHVALAAKRAAAKFALKRALASVFTNVQFQVFFRPVGKKYLELAILITANTKIIEKM